MHASFKLSTQCLVIKRDLKRSHALHCNGMSLLPTKWDVVPEMVAMISSQQLELSTKLISMLLFAGIKGRSFDVDAHSKKKKTKYMSNGVIIGRIIVLPSINQCEATPKTLKLCSEVGIGLNLMHERLSSRLRIQIRYSALVINPEMKLIKNKNLFALNNAADSLSLEQPLHATNISGQNRQIHLIGLIFYNIDKKVNYKIVNVQDGSTYVIAEYDLIEDLDIGDKLEMELSRVLPFIELQH